MANVLYSAPPTVWKVGVWVLSLFAVPWLSHGSWRSQCIISCSKVFLQVRLGILGLCCLHAAEKHWQLGNAATLFNFDLKGHALS